jgi:hypothetical protein
MPSNNKDSNQIDRILIGNNINNESSTTYYEYLDAEEDDIQFKNIDKSLNYHDISDLILNAHDEDDENVINADIDTNVNLVYEEDPYTLRRFVKGFFHSNRYHVFIIILVIIIYI